MLSVLSPATPVRFRRPERSALVLAVILASQLMVVLDVTIVNIALPDMRRALGFSPEGLSWVLNAYTLTFGGLLLLGARAGDLLGRRRTFLGGLALFTAASLLGGFAGSASTLLAARAVQGVGAALAAPSALALLMTMFPDGRERTRAIGWYTAVSIGGSAVGLIAGGLLTQWASWRWVLFVNVPIGAAVIALARTVLHETPMRRGHFDIAGAMTSTGGMTALVYGFVRAATDGWRDGLTLGAFAAGVVLLTVFIRIEQRAEAPITPLRLFADRGRATSYAARLLLMAAMIGMFFFLTQFLQDVLGYGAVQTGFAFLPLTAMLFVSSQASARLVERVDPVLLMAGGLTLSTAGLFWLSQLAQSSGYPALFGPLVLFGLGNGLAFVPLTAASLRGVDPRDAGAASGLVNVMQQVGGALGLSVLVTVFGAATPSGRGLTPAEFVVGADRVFQVATGLLAVTALLIAAALRPQRVLAAS